MENLTISQSTYSNWYNYMFKEAADKRLTNWAFMNGPDTLISILIFYLMTIYVILPNYMKNRKAYELKNVILLYNIFQILSCLYLVIGALLNGWIQSKVRILGCTPPDYSDDPMAINQLTLMYQTFLLKLIDLLETAFFVLRKKQNQVSSLHVYHHVSTPLVAWSLTKYVGGGMMTFPVIINNFIHVLMYSYYALSSLGPEWQKKLAPWKSKLTAAQLIQFGLLIGHAAQAALPSCNVSKIILLIYIPNVAMNVHLFSAFYKKSYTSKKIKS